MIIALYGPDDYRREQKKREIIAEFKKKHSALGIEIFDAQEEAALADIQAFLRNQSIFEPKKLAVVANAFTKKGADDDGLDSADAKKKDAAKNITTLLKAHISSPDSTILLVLDKKPPKPAAFLMKAPVLFQEFDLLTGDPWLAFVRGEAKRAGIVVSAGATRFLGKVHEGNPWALVTELQKIAAFKNSVDEEDLDLFDLDVAPNYWGLLNAAKSYDLKVRLAALETLFFMNDPAAKIFNILAASWKERLPQMASYDRAIKSGRFDYEEALVDLVL